MTKWYRRAITSVAVAMALLLPAMALHLAYADQPEALKVRVEINDGGFNGNPGDFTIEVEQGQLVELTFVWDQKGYVQDEHIMVLAGYKLEWDPINSEHREATLTFIADKPGTFDLKCDEDCQIHDILQQGTLKVTRGAGGSGAPAYVPTALSLSSSSLVTAGDPVVLTAGLRDTAGKPVSKAEVRFLQDTTFAGTKAQMEVGVGKTDANGVAFLTFHPTLADHYQTITATFAGMGLYAESQEAIQITEAGVPPAAYKTAAIGLEPLRRWAPVALAGIILGVWSTFGFVMFQALSVARARR